MVKNNVLSAQLINQLEEKLSGRIIRPIDADYDEARSVWNGMINRYPAFIVRCQNTSDVVAAVNFARENKIPFSVRGGGHNVAGTAVIDNGMVIDLSEMTNVLINPTAKTVQVDGGATWAHVDTVTQRYGLAVPGGVVSETGVAGLTLGGGVGWMRNKYGLTCDNLLSAEVVTGDGRVLTASETENPDLFWALRGGGGIGIVTRFEFRLHPIGPDVMFVLTIYPGDEAEAVMKFVREYVIDAPDEASVIVSLGHVPSVEDFPQEAHGKTSAIILACYTGDAAEGEKVLQPLRDITTPIVDFSGKMPYVEVQTLFDHDYPAGEMRYYWKSTYLDEMSDEVIQLLIQHAKTPPSNATTIDIWHLGSAVRQVPEAATAYSHRSARYLIGIESNWLDAQDDDANIDWARTLEQALLPYSQGRQYMNFPGLWEGDENALKAMVGGNFARLTEIRARYDPNKRFSPRN